MNLNELIERIKTTESHHTAVTLDNSTHNRLKLFCELNKLSISRTIRILINQGLNEFNIKDVRSKLSNEQFENPLAIAIDESTHERLKKISEKYDLRIVRFVPVLINDQLNRIEDAQK